MQRTARNEDGERRPGILLRVRHASQQGLRVAQLGSFAEVHPHEFGWGAQVVVAIEGRGVPLPPARRQCVVYLGRRGGAVPRGIRELEVGHNRQSTDSLPKVNPKLSLYGQGSWADVPGSQPDGTILSKLKPRILRFP